MEIEDRGPEFGRKTKPEDSSTLTSALGDTDRRDIQNPGENKELTTYHNGSRYGPIELNSIEFGLCNLSRNRTGRRKRKTQTLQVEFVKNVFRKRRRQNSRPVGIGNNPSPEGTEGS